MPTQTRSYACSLYGANLWNLYGPTAGQVYKCWNISVRDAWSVSRITRTYIVDNLLAGSLPPIKQLVLLTLSHCATNIVQSTTGLDVANIRQEFGLDALVHGPNMFTVKKRDIPQSQEEDLELLQLVETEPDIVSLSLIHI